jgi:hypothetical protein
MPQELRHAVESVERRKSGGLAQQQVAREPSQPPARRRRIAHNYRTIVAVAEHDFTKQVRF